MKTLKAFAAATAVSLVLAANSMAQQLPVGNWSGTARPPGMNMEVPISFDVSYPDGAIKLVMNMPGGPAPRVEAREIRVTETSISWSAGRPDSQMQVQCSVEKQDDGTYAGKCVNARVAGSDPMLFNMVPPGR